MSAPVDVRDDEKFGRMDCKHCYTNDVQTVSLYECPANDGLVWVQALCGNCGAGLTPPEPFDWPPGELAAWEAAGREVDWQFREFGNYGSSRRSH